MSSAAESWYVDPSTGTNLRFWDGSTWTDQVAPLPYEAPHASQTDLFATRAQDEPATSPGRGPVAEPVVDDEPDPVVETAPDPVVETTPAPVAYPAPMAVAAAVTESAARPARGRHAGTVDIHHLEPELERTQLTRRELRTRRDGRIDRHDVPKHLPSTVPPAPESIDHLLQPEDELELPQASDDDPETELPEEPRQRNRRALRLSLLLGILTVASSVAVLTAGTL